MKIRAIISDQPGHASNWWRIQRPLEMMRVLGHDTIYGTLGSFNDADFKDAIVVVHRLIPGDPKEFIDQLRKAGATQIVYSLDDLTFDPFALREYLDDCGGLTQYAIQRIIDRIPKHIETIALCDAVIVSTTPLQEKVSKLVGVPRIYVLPNALDIDWYTDNLDPESPHCKNGNLVHIGYASGRRPEDDLSTMAKAWGRIDKEFDNVRFVVAGFPHDIIDQNINPEKKIRFPWVTLQEWPKSMQVDIGCCPLALTTFNESKSPIKYFEYSMAGAAVVASGNIGVYSLEILHGIDGFLASTEDEWFNKLCELVKHKTTRSRIEDNAAYNIRNYKSLQATIRDWEFVFETIANGGSE